jgi:outer membrane murein-binding lipoprotein Lpp
MLVQLINSINKLSTLVQNVNDSIAKLSTQINQLEGKMSGFSNVETQVSEVGLKLGEIPGIKNMISNLNAKIDGLGSATSQSAPVAQDPKSKPEKKKKEEKYVSPGVVEEEPSVAGGSEADAAFTAVSSKFKHITQMISPNSSCGNISQMLEELRDEVETQVGMSPMLYELNSWVQRISKMPDGDVLLPEVHSELLEKLDDWLNRVTKAIHLKYQ